MFAEPLHVDCSPAPKRFVVDAVVAKKFVVVADVPVAFTNVKDWRVDEPVERRFEAVSKPDNVAVPPIAVV